MIAKEFRALLPLWAAAVATMILAKALGNDFGPLAVPAFVLGSAMLGAWGIGHEYSHRTLGGLLTLPVPRARIWMAKLAVVAPMLVVLALLALWIFPRGNRFPIGIPTYFLPAIAALCVTPWLTMASRSAVGGALFTISIAAIFTLAGDWIGVKKYGYSREVDSFRLAFLWWTMGALSVVGAVCGWRMFSRLQAMDGRGAAIHLRFGSGATETPTAVRGNVGWMLIKKELRLQQLSWIVAGIWALVYVVIVITRQGQRDAENYVSLVAVIHGLIQSLLIGSLASAEERHTGMHDTQLLLPMSSARQWMVKGVVAVSLAIVLSIGLPLILSIVLPVEGVRPFGRYGFFKPQTFAGVVAVTSISLYVSTLTASGLRALMLSIPVMFAMAWFAMRVGSRVSWTVYLWMRSPPPGSWAPMPVDSFFLGGCLALGGLVLWRALAHYRWIDRRPARIAGDAALVAVAVVAYFALSGAIHLR